MNYTLIQMDTNTYIDVYIYTLKNIISKNNCQ